MTEPYKVGERRPIRARSWGVSKSAATWLARRNASPNGISIAGMICGIGAGIALAATAQAPLGHARVEFLLGGLLIVLRLLANMLDGMVAVEGGKASPVGELYNEVPDRISDTATLIGAGYAVGGDIVLGLLAACVALFTAYVRAMGKAAGASHEFCGPMAKQQRMLVVILISLYCAAVPLQWQAPIAGWGMMELGLLVIIVLGLFTALRRLLRVAATLRGARA
jgi:phosphatidylglycerophosphate synthase